MRAIFGIALVLFFNADGGFAGAETTAAPSTQVDLNSIGYLPDATKVATVTGSGKEFAVYDFKTGKEVAHGELAKINPAISDEGLSLADFTEAKQEGEYRLVVAGHEKMSARFCVGPDVYNWPFYCAFRAMYLWRCGTKVSGEFDGRRYQHAACHLDDAYLNYIGGPNDKRRASTGGWHDAGDYNKYTVNGAFTVGMLLKAWEHFPGKLGSLKFDIPESNNATPDFLDEIRWELDWLFTMQAADGRVYHKVSALKFGGFVLPEKDTERRYFSPWSSAATADFAAVMAEAARTLRSSDPQYASRCLAAAKNSYEFLQAHPDEHQPDLSAFATGGYETPDLDDRLWAAAELWESTGDARYLRDCEHRISTFPGEKFKSKLTIDVDWDWGNVRNLGVFTYLRSSRSGRDTALLSRVREDAVKGGDMIVAKARANPYARPLGSTYYWGCNGTVARQVMNLQIAYQLTGNRKYRDTMLGALDYLFGRNAYGRSFVTGLGRRPPLHPHDRRSGGDQLDLPWPGYLVGGGWPKETSWSDDEADYRTNEIAINWNGALIYALAAFVEPESFDESIKAAQDVLNSSHSSR
jgi:endoglucanase